MILYHFFDVFLSFVVSLEVYPSNKIVDVAQVTSEEKSLIYDEATN